MLLIAMALGTIAASTLSACGDGDEDSPTETLQGEAAKPPLPPDAPLTQQLGRAFPRPEPIEGAPPKAQAFIDAGRKACNGKSPSQVIDEFLPQAGADDFDESQEELIGKIGQYEQNPTADFAAGQIAAGVYEATLPELQQRSGYQGCVYELAQQLRRELARQG
jgi:hypothetical protein